MHIGYCKTWTLDSGLDLWTRLWAGLWSEIWTNAELSLLAILWHYTVYVHDPTEVYTDSEAVWLYVCVSQVGLNKEVHDLLYQIYTLFSHCNQEAWEPAQT